MKAKDVVRRKLYMVYFDDNNNPTQVKIAPFDSNGGHGLKKWKVKDGINYFSLLC